MKLQPVDDFVDHLALGAYRQANQIELCANHRLHLREKRPYPELADRVVSLRCNDSSAIGDTADSGGQSDRRIYAFTA